MVKPTYAESPFHRLKKSVTDISADTEHLVKNIGNCNISCCGAVPTLKKINKLEIGKNDSLKLFSQISKNCSKLCTFQVDVNIYNYLSIHDQNFVIIAGKLVDSHNMKYSYSSTWTKIYLNETFKTGTSSKTSSTSHLTICWICAPLSMTLLIGWSSNWSSFKIETG